MRAADCKKLVEKPEGVFRQALPQSPKRGLRLFHSLQLEFGCDIIGKAEEKETKHMDHGAYAAELFYKGYNCAQAVTVAFCDVTGLSEDFSARLASSFGGGMGRMREVCGAVSGMMTVLGLLYGYSEAGNDAVKKAHYQNVQALAGAFREQCGSIICREILKNPPSDPNPTPRTPEFYRTRPCARMVATAAGILDRFIEEHPIHG